MMLIENREASALRLVTTGAVMGSPTEFPDTLKQQLELRHQLQGVLFDGPMTWNQRMPVRPAVGHVGVVGIGPTTFRRPQNVWPFTAEPTRM